MEYPAAEGGFNIGWLISLQEVHSFSSKKHVHLNSSAQ